MIILGIDPGTATIGYGVLDAHLRGKKTTIECLSYGLIETTSGHSFPKRLEKISREIRKLLKEHRPELMTIESVFFFKNLKTFIPVSRAEGVIILEAAKQKIPLIEFTPMQVKARVAGYGRAEKTEVQRKVKEILKLKELPKADDVADALGVAICGALSLGQRG